MTKAQGQVGAFGSTTSKVLAGTGLAFAAIGAISIKAASDLGESLNKARVVFGSAQDSVIRFSETTAKSMGIAQATALEAAASFGAMAQSAGLSEKASAELSIDLVQLAADMASFNNQDPSEMLERLRSGLAGEAEPLRRFGIFISEARVETEAYAAGIAQAGEELTDAQKIQARFNIIMQDTAKQQGDFARTVGESLPNQLRILKAELIDLAAQFGQVLLPIALKVVQAFRVLGPVLKIAADNVGLIFAALVGFSAVHFLPPLLLSIATGLEAIGAASIANGVLSVAVALEGLVSAAGGFVAVAGAIPVVGYKLVQAIAPVDEATQQLNERMKDFGVVRGPAMADAATRIAAELEVQQAKAALAASGVNNLSGAAGDLTDKTIRLSRETRELTDEFIDQRLAMLSLSNSFLGIATQADAVNEAQRELNRLERQGKEDTKAYEQAVLDALEAQIGLEEAVFNYAKELADSGEKASAVRQKVRDLADQFNIQKGNVDDLIGRINEYVNQLNGIPDRVQTTVSAVIATPSELRGSLPQAQAGGYVARSGVAVIHRGETVVPAGAGGVTINVQGWVGDEAALTRKIEEMLNRNGRRNGGRTLAGTT